MPWQRRAYLYPTKAEQAFGQDAANKLQRLWGEVFAKANAREINADFVYVSDYLRRTVEEDYGLSQYPNLRIHIIPNCIDTKLFAYQEKTAEQRKKILSIQSFASPKYCNDLTAAAIVLLSKEPFFDELEFLIAGDGALFEKTVAPLRKFKNVTICRRFYSHEELAALYAEYGIAILPTRQDTQGVSRDEAFSCGMAVITSNCACVPEFCDESCAILAQPENPQAIASGVKRLYGDADYFMQMSKAARQRALLLSASYTIPKELALFASAEPAPPQRG